MSYNQNGCHGHHRIALSNLGGKSNKWSENWTWIYDNHHNPYILMANFGLSNHWLC